MTDMARRPIASRDTSWARAIAGWLADHRIQPNFISVLSVLFAAAAGGTAWYSRSSVWLLLGTAVGIQLRLLCNLFDGMVAVEGGLKSKTGNVFNDLPDRFADLLIIVPLGYATGEPWGGELGWAAGALAVFTAYVRLLGGALGLPQSFAGPMAKQQRMAIATVASLGTIAEASFHLERFILTAAVALIAIGSLVTVFRRSQAILRELESR